MEIGSPHRSPSNWMGFSCNTNLDKECASALTICIMQTHRRRWLFLLLLLSAWKSPKTGVLMLCILQVANLSLSPAPTLDGDCCCFNSRIFPKPKKKQQPEEKNLFMNLTSTIYVYFLFVSPSSIVCIDFREFVSELSVCLLFAWINSSSTSTAADIGYIKNTQK